MLFNVGKLYRDHLHTQKKIKTTVKLEQLSKIHFLKIGSLKTTPQHQLDLKECFWIIFFSNKNL